MLQLNNEVTAVEVISEIDSKMGGLKFPLNLTIENLMRRPLFHPLDSKNDIYLKLDSNAVKGVNKGDFKFLSKDSLVQFLDNSLAIMRLYSYKKALNIEFEEFEEHQEIEEFEETEEPQEIEEVVTETKVEEIEEKTETETKSQTKKKNKTKKQGGK